MHFLDKQIKPPANWTIFENLCHSLFKEVWNDPLAAKNGRGGQEQNGVDVSGSQDGQKSFFFGLQCKGKDGNYGKKVLLKEFKEELKKAEKFKPKLNHWILVTTAGNDQALQEEVGKIASTRKKQGKFIVDILGWGEIQMLLVKYPTVLEEFYPEDAFDIPSLLKKLEKLPDFKVVGKLLEDLKEQIATDTNARLHGTWEILKFDNGRGLGPALMGRPLAPADAASCPRLIEADNVVLELKTGYSVKVIGQPGTGKSVCAYQAALTLVKEGAQVFRLRDPSGKKLWPLPKPTSNKGVYIVDDAHLLPADVLKSLEDNANENTLVISTHSAIDLRTAARGSVIIDSKRAVSTIAKQLLRNRKSTLAAVKLADNNIGDHMMDSRLEDRIEVAERDADYPWQFSFILGGGWQRSKLAVDSSRATKSDSILLVASMNQICSRDARLSQAGLIELGKEMIIPESEVIAALKWLVDQRYIISMDDCRTPHQLFAGGVMHRIILAQTKEERESSIQFLNKILRSEKYPLMGIRSMLHELAFPPANICWRSIIQEETKSAIQERCWAAKTVEERLNSSWTLTELMRFIEEGDKAKQFKPRLKMLGQWINKATKDGGGIGSILNDIYNDDKSLAEKIVSFSDPKKLAKSFSNVEIENAYGISYLVSRAYIAGSEEWRCKFRVNLDSVKLMNIAKTWNDPDKIWYFAEVCKQVAYLNNSVALDMIVAFTPTLLKALQDKTVERFREFDDAIQYVLHQIDPLGVFVGKNKAKPREIEIAKRICKGISADAAAKSISETKVRDFQSASYLLKFIVQCSSTKFNNVIGHINWDKLAGEIGEDWESPSHEIEVLLGILCSTKAGHKEVISFLNKHGHKISVLPPRLAYISEDLMLAHVKAGKSISFFKHSHIDTSFGPAVIQTLGKKAPNLANKAVQPFSAGIASVISQPHQSWYTRLPAFLLSIMEFAPNVLKSAFSSVDLQKAAEGWANALVAGGPQRDSAALLIEASIKLNASTRPMAEDLRKKHPRASVPRAPQEIIRSVSRSRDP